jgi:hypothetical protein
VLGGYWDTYVWAPLQREGAILPIPREGEYQRTVWWARELVRHPRALVEHSNFPEAGTAEAPAPWLVQYGAPLRLEQPRWDAGAGRTFSLYRNALADALPHTASPPLTEWRPCTPGASLTLSFPPRPQALVLVALSGPPGAVTLSAEPLLVEGAGPAPAPVPLSAHERLHHARLDGGGALLRGVRLTATPTGADARKEGACRGQATLVLDPARDAGPSPTR